MKWSVVYKKCYNDDGSLFFPEKLNEEFLQGARRTMGTYLFANQYLNEVFPSEAQKFKPHWFQYYSDLPKGYDFAFIDPAISTEDGADYTATVVLRACADGNCYIRLAQRNRFTPTEVVNHVFELQKEFECMAIGIESVAYQKALIYMLDEETRRRKVILPIKDCHPGTDRTKEARILSLVPRIEWGRIKFPQGLADMEQEFLQFPRGQHDDIIDALQQVFELVIYPEPEKEEYHDDPTNPYSRNYESHLAKKYAERANEQLEQYESE